MRISAIHSLGELGDKRVVEPIIELLKDEYVEVREKAKEVLKKIKVEK